MSEKIVKLQPIPSDASNDDIRHILKDFKIQQVSIRGDAAYVKFEEFGEDEIDLLDFNFADKTYNEKGWNATISVLPASDWDSSEEEAIESEKKVQVTAPKHTEPEYEEAEEIKTSGVTEEKETEAVSVPEYLVNDGPEVVSSKQVPVSPAKFESQVGPNSYPSLQQSPGSTFRTSEYVPQVIPQIKEVLKPAYIKLQQSSVLPEGVKQKVEEVLYQAKEAAFNQLNNFSGQSIPSWIWPLALVFTLLSLTMH